ncbi:hypothetical protein RLOC_00001609 [Lonchura striata]|uniref:Uncharacterized protein n=1 Tax=Lonchura striata TaxID=40157 RepID=A0A218UL13_9PASE|nr:hypothetical protein RLOC_00001609 [Lonchura striata domestica]
MSPKAPGPGLGPDCKESLYRRMDPRPKLSPLKISATLIDPREPYKVTSGTWTDRREPYKLTSATWTGEFSFPEKMAKGPKRALQTDIRDLD